MPDDLTKNGKSRTALLGRGSGESKDKYPDPSRNLQREGRRIENPTGNGMKRMHGKEAETRMPASVETRKLRNLTRRVRSGHNPERKCLVDKVAEMRK
jgi:hypothetical protein